MGFSSQGMAVPESPEVWHLRTACLLCDRFCPPKKHQFILFAFSFLCQFQKFEEIGALCTQGELMD